MNEANDPRPSLFICGGSVTIYVSTQRIMCGGCCYCYCWCCKQRQERLARGNRVFEVEDGRADGQLVAMSADEKIRVSAIFPTWEKNRTRKKNLRVFQLDKKNSSTFLNDPSGRHLPKQLRTLQTEDGALKIPTNRHPCKHRDPTCAENETRRISTRFAACFAHHPHERKQLLVNSAC